MSDAAFPQTHSTTTGTATATAYAVTGRPYLDTSKITTLPIILKIAEVVVCFVTFIFCVVTHDHEGKAGWGAFVAFMGFLLTALLLGLILFHVMDLIPRLPWPLIELVYYGLFTFFFFVAAICLAVLATYIFGTPGLAGFSSFLLFVCTAMFGFDTFLNVQKFREASSEPPPPQEPPQPQYGVPQHTGYAGAP